MQQFNQHRGYTWLPNRSPNMKIDPADTDRAARGTGEVMREALEQKLEEGPQAWAHQPPAIPDHTLLRRIGTGAYGEVFLARNALGTARAVKVVYRDRFEDERPYQREFNGILKYEPISRTHEGLMAVLHVGCHDKAEYFYYIMDLADPMAPQASNEEDRAGPLRRKEGSTPNGGDNQADPSGPGPPLGSLLDVRSYVPRTLREELRCKGRLPPIEAAQLGARVASALAHLHARGLVHRDVKPSNVIFIGGHPKLADIGLVTGAGDSRSFVGTEGFIPPEGPGTPQADLYGLGKLLYELITGRDRLDFPQLPAGLSVEGESLLELNEVVTRACAPDARLRYSTAVEMLADLNLMLSGQSLREARRLKRHVYWLKRFSAGACLLVVLAGVAVWVAHDTALRAHEREQQSHDRVVLESALRRRAQAAEHDARRQLYSALLEEARGHVHSTELGQRTRALDAIARAGAISNTPALRSVAFSALALPDLRFDRLLPARPGASGEQLDPAFERIACCMGRGPVQIRSASDGHLLASLAPSGAFPSFSAHWSADGRLLMIKRDRDNFGQQGDLEIWDTVSNTRIGLFKNIPWGTASFHPHRDELAVALSGGGISIKTLPSGEETRQFKVGVNAVCILYSPDGERLAVAWAGQSDWIVSIFSIATGAQLARSAVRDQISTMDWHPGGRWIAVADYGGRVSLLDSFTGEARNLGRHKVQAVLTAFSPDGDYLVTGGWERELICWNLRTLQRAFTIPLNSFQAQFSADGRQCAIATEQGIEFHRFEPSVDHREFAEELGARLRHAFFSPDGRWLAASGNEGLAVWDLANQGPAAFHTEGANAQALFFSPDSSQLYISSDGDCFRWRLVPAQDPTHPPALETVALSKPEGFTALCLASNRVIFTAARGSGFASDDNGSTPALWNRTQAGFSGASPDGKWLAIYASFSSLLYVYRLPDFEPVAALDHDAAIRGFEFFPDRDELVVALSRGVQFWSMKTWQKKQAVSNFMDIILTPDPPCWLIQDYQHGGLYDLKTLTPLLPLPNGILPMALSPDGRNLAVSVEGRRIQVWDLEMVRREFRKLGIDWHGGG